MKIDIHKLKKGPKNILTFTEIVITIPKFSKDLLPLSLFDIVF